MHATRALQSAFKGFLIPPRTTWGILSSAGNACVALLTRQGERDNFVDMLNRGIINPPVLGQANFGMAMILALYNDLNSPLFKKYGFSIKEFTAGARPALERFHDVQITLQEDLHRADEEEGGGGDGVRDGGEGSDRPADDGSESDGAPGAPKAAAAAAEPADSAPAPAPNAEILMRALGGARSEGVDRVLKRRWAKEAEKDPDSLAGQLRAMTTPEYFDAIEISSKTNYLLEKKFNYTAGSGEITNMALLSARAMELPPSIKTETDESDHGTPMADDSLSDAEEIDPPVAAQVEVLYDIEQTVKLKDGDASGEDAESGGNSTPRRSVLVGVFQGWLHGDPDGNESVRWKLALNRPAWEFPYLISG